MGNWSLRPLQQNVATETFQQSWNITELASHKQLRTSVYELIELTLSPSTSRSVLQHYVDTCTERYGTRFTAHLVRTLTQHEQDEREAIVYLLTLLNAPESIPLLQQLVHNTHLPRAVRLSARLALAGLGATLNPLPPPPRYAIS